MTDPFVHVIAALAVLSRVADIGTTYLVTPKLKLEANGIARRLGWPFAWATVLVGLVAYVSPPGGVMILTLSFLVAAFNASKIMMARALGEDEMEALLRRVVVATPPWPGLLFMLLPAFLIATLGGCVLLFYPDCTRDWGFYFAAGMFAFAVAMCVWYPVRYFRMRAEAQKATAEASDHSA